MTTVRSFSTGDEAAVVALWDGVFADARAWNAPAAIVERKRAQADGLFWVAVEGGRIVGAVMAGYDGHRGWIYHLAVAAASRRRGVGRSLVGAAECALAARGCPKVNLQILEQNRDVIAFYERLGYVVEPRASMGKRLAARDDAVR